MHISTEDPSRQEQPLRRAKFISEGTVGRLSWIVYSAEVDFYFRVRLDGDAIFTSEAEYVTAPKAEKAAKAWCAAWCADPSNAPVNTGTSVPKKAEVAGWEITVVDDRGGTYKAELVNAETGECGTDEFKGYLATDAALAEASAWAKANPCDGSAPEAVGEAPPSPTEAIAEALLEAEAVETEELPAFIHDEGGEYPPEEDQDAAHAALDADAQLRELRRQLAEKDRQLGAMKADIREAGAQADEASTLLAEIVEDEATLKALKDALKAKKSRFDLITGKMARHVKAVLHGGEPPAYQLTFGGDPATRAVIGADAAQVAEALPVTWPFNGKEYTIDVEPVATGGFVAWLRGHRAATESPDETREGAIEAAKGRAATTLADAEPGESVPQDEVEVKRPPKAGPKLKGRDADAVRAVLRTSPALIDALEQLACTKKQLENFCKKVGIENYSTEIHKDVELPAAPAEKATTRGRGRGGRKGRGK